MNVRCPKCDGSNPWWRSRCESCNAPLDRGAKTPDDLLREAIEQFSQRTAPIPVLPPMDPAVFPIRTYRGGCAACETSGICNCTINPGRITIS